MWELSGAAKCDLYSPDVSFNASVKVRLYDAGGKLLDTKSIIIFTNKNGWKKFREHFDVTGGVVVAEVAIEFNKTHGDLWVDDFSAKYAGKSIPMEGGDRRTVFECNRVGFLFYPGDDVTLDMSLETPVTLSGDTLNVAWELTDYWGEKQATTQSVKFTPDGKAANGWNRYRATLDLTALPLKPGPYYEVHTFANLGAPSLAKDKASFAILPEAATRGYDPMEVPFGAHTWNATV